MEISDLIQKAADRIERVETTVAELEQKADRNYAELSAVVTDVAQKAGSGMAIDGSNGGKGRSPALTFAKSDELKALLERRSRRASVPMALTLKALTTAGLGGSTDGSYPTRADRDDRLANDPRRRLTLLEALPRIPVGSSSFEYAALSNYSNAAGEQGDEGATKPAADVDTELVTARIATVAHFLRCSTQVLADNAALQVQLENLLGFGVASKLEELIVSGSGQIQGLQQLGTAYAPPSGLRPADRIGATWADMEEAGWRPSHVLLNPFDWQTIRAERDQELAYVAGGWGVADPMQVWGLSVVTTASLARGDVIVLDAAQVSMLDRQQVVVEAFPQDGENVSRNLVTLRAEARAGLAVFSPDAVRLIDFEETSES